MLQTANVDDGGGQYERWRVHLLLNIISPEKYIFKNYRKGKSLSYFYPWNSRTILKSY